jgi:hypothetical protein
MRSFEIPVERWQEIEARLEGRLKELDGWRERFHTFGERIQNAVSSMRRSHLPGLVDSRNDEPESRYAAVPQDEAIVFAKRHRGEWSPVAAYRDAVRRIEREHRTMRFSNDLLKEFHRSVVDPDAAGAGEWKSVSNFIPGYSADGSQILSILTTHHELVPEYLHGLNERANTLWDSQTFHALLITAAYSLDLLAIHPFADGNGRVSRLAMLLQLYKAGHFVGRYISLEGTMGRRLSRHIVALRTSLDGWPTAQHDPSAWCEFVLDVFGECYATLSRRTRALESTATDIESLIKSIGELPEEFFLDDLKSVHPDIPKEMVGIVVNRLRARGKLRATITGGQVRLRRSAAGL